MSLLCLVAGAVTVALNLPQDRFTLSWTHSVEKLRWEETYLVSPDGLLLQEARVRGSGAGMEPPEGARLMDDGSWRYEPKLPVLPELSLAASGYTDDYLLCASNVCRPLGSILGPGPNGVILKPCPHRTKTNTRLSPD